MDGHGFQMEKGIGEDGERMNDTLPPWIKTQYKDLEKRIIKEGDLNLLKLIAEYRGYYNIPDYAVSLLNRELSCCKNDLRFGRWLKLKGETRKAVKGERC